VCDGLEALALGGTITEKTEMQALICQCHKIFTVAGYNSRRRQICTSLVPPSSRRCGLLGAGFPRHARESASKAFGHPKLIGRLFFGIRSGVHLRTIKLALVAAGLCMAQSAPASAACVVLAGTADGFDKETAVSRAQRALGDYIEQYKTENHLDAVTISAMRAEPQPYWRGRVSENMMYHPDVVTAESYTVCWQGVVSTYVALQVRRSAGNVAGNMQGSS
jgi:hypothetical protein